MSLRISGLAALIASLGLAVALATAATRPDAPGGARRWDVPGGWFMLPDWEVKHHVVEKAMGAISVSRPGTGGGGLCLTWAYQAAPLSPKELSDGAPTYAALLKSFMKDSIVGALTPRGDNEVEVIDGHAAVVTKFAAGASEATLALWDCPESHRTFAVMCYAPQKSIAGRLFYAVSKYAACHAEPVAYETAGPLTVTIPPDWKAVQTGPTQQILASPDHRSAVYLFALAASQAQRVTARDAETVVDTTARLAGKLSRREPAEITTDAKLQHDVARVKAVVQVEGRSALAVFDVWYCPQKQRMFVRAALSEAADGLEKANAILDSVRCH